MSAFNLNDYGTYFSTGGSTGSTITLSGVISSDPGFTSALRFDGPAGNSTEFNLTNTNTFTGNVSLAAGTLGITAGASLGSPTNVLALEVGDTTNGGLVFLNSGVTVAQPIVVRAPTRIVSSQTSRIGSQTYGNLTWTATPTAQFDLEMETLAGPTTLVGTTLAGLMADFDPTQSYSWPIITYQGSFSGPTSDSELTADSFFDTSLFANAIPTGATFGLHLDQYPSGGGELDLIYTPTAVPEPGTMALSGLAAIGWVSFWRRRWHSELSAG